MLLRFYFITPHYEIEHESHQPYLANAYQGIYRAEEVLFDEINTDNGEELEVIHHSNLEVKDLGLKKLPSFVVYDPEKGNTLFILPKSLITIENVKTMCLAAWRMKKDEENEGAYISPSGMSLSVKKLQRAKPCPASMPVFVKKIICDNGLSFRWSTGTWIGIFTALLVIVFLVVRLLKR